MKSEYCDRVGQKSSYADIGLVDRENLVCERNDFVFNVPGLFINFEPV